MNGICLCALASIGIYLNMAGLDELTSLLLYHHIQKHTSYMPSDAAIKEDVHAAIIFVVWMTRILRKNHDFVNFGLKFPWAQRRACSRVYVSVCDNVHGWMCACTCTRVCWWGARVRECACVCLRVCCMWCALVCKCTRTCLWVHFIIFLDMNGCPCVIIRIATDNACKTVTITRFSIQP